MSYSYAKDCWLGFQQYNLSGLKANRYTEPYVAPVTLPYDQWIRYVSRGDNVLLGSGGVISGGTVQTPFGGSRAVYKGYVRQGYGS